MHFHDLGALQEMKNKGKLINQITDANEDTQVDKCLLPHLPALLNNILC